MLKAYSSVDADSNRSVIINMGPQAIEGNDISKIQVSNGDSIRIMMPVYQDIEGDSIRISFSNVENYLLALTFTARPINVYSDYTEYALISETIEIG